MDGPEVLVSHYASLAFYTRIAALTFVGGIGGVVLGKSSDIEVRYVAGVGILLVLAALAEFNRRYTHAYVAAVYAACGTGTDSGEQDPAAERWQSFRKLNGLTPDAVRARMLLSSLTYLPGFVLGEYLLFTCSALGAGTVAILLGAGTLSWLVWVAVHPTIDDILK